MVQNANPVTGSLPDWLEQDGFEVWSAHLDSGPDYTAPLKDNARCLGHQIAQIRDRAPDGQVILIAHSMGGVVARAYIEDDALFQNDVKILFTLGSPHQGVPYKIVKYIDRFHLNKISFFDSLSCDKDKQPAMCELLAKNMAAFNQAHSHRAQGVSYYLVSGDLPFRQATLWGRIVSAWAKGPDDGFIQLASGLNLTGVHQTLQTNEAHTDSFGSRTYFVAPPGESHSSAYANCIRPVLQGDPDGCSPSRAQTALRPPDPSFNALVPLVEDTLSSAQQMTHSINLDRTGDVFFAAVWESGSVNFTLTRPNGQTIDPAYAATHADEVNYLPAEPDVPPAGASYFIPHAQAGVWLMHLKAGDLPAGAANYGVLVTLESAITLDVEVDKSQYTPGQTAIIQARLGGEVAETTIEVQIERPDGIVDTLTLTPQQDGTYSGTYTMPSLPGYITLTALAHGKDRQGQAFSREAVIDYQILSSPELPPTAALISGRVLLQSRAEHNGTNIYLITDEEQCLPVSGAVPGAPDAVTDANGYFEIRSTPGQTYACLKAIHHHYLTGQKLVPQGNLGPVTLPSGDVTGDNLINIFDLSYIASRYDSDDPTADTNADGLIDIFDLTIVGGNFGQSQPVWGP
jgi:pimeloyl-ACP methyl ester carboxylesterase